MENVTKLLKMAFAIIIFCIGLFLMVYEAKTYHNMLNTTRDKLKEKELYQQYHVIDQEIVTRCELIASLFYPLDYDITIEDEVIRKTEHNLDKITSYDISYEEYRKRYRYDENGTIVMVIYAGVNR